MLRSGTHRSAPRSIPRPYFPLTLADGPIRHRDPSHRRRMRHEYRRIRRNPEGFTIIDEHCLFGRDTRTQMVRSGKESASMPSSHYIGKADHLAVMGELALRGYNVAMPEIDKGDDIFVVRNDTGAMWRLQVKTSLGARNARSKRFQFRIREASIQSLQNPDLHFVFAMRRKGRWRYLIMDRPVLRNYVINHKLGSLSGPYRQVVVTLTDGGKATCSRQDLTNHLNDWNTWPKI